MIINKLFPKFYEFLNPRGKDNARHSYYSNRERLVLSSMFGWYCKAFPKELPPSFIELGLSAIGSLAFYLNDSRLEVVKVAPADGIDGYGNPKNVIITWLDGKTKTVPYNDVVIIRNNSTVSADFNVDRDADILSEIDLSLEYLVQNSRLAPVPVAKNSIVKKAIEVVLAKIRKGEEYAPIMAENTAFSPEVIDVINLTDVSASEKIQHLTRLRSEILKSFYDEYGIPLQTVNQGSQTNTEELHAMDTLARVVPLDRLAMRRKACAEVYEKWGIDIDVSFSESWSWVNQPIESADETADETADESADEMEGGKVNE